MRKFASLIVLLIALPIFAQRDIETVNIENAAVRAYMADAQRTYTSTSDYNVSVITKYNDSKYGTKLYWPNGKEVSWTPSTSPDNIKEVRITVRDAYDPDHVYTFNPSEKSASSYIIRNLLPNTHYKYTVEEFYYSGKPSRSRRAHGEFKTTGQVRMIQVGGCANVRDLGGWPSQYGPRLKYGKLFRSANLDHINSKGIHDFVENLNVRAELDLRSEAVGRSTSPLGSDKNYLCVAHGGYLSAITKRSSVYPQDLRWINARLREGKSVDWHCAIGCDRCGTLSFLIEGLLGLSELDLCRDYELSTFLFSKKNKRARKSIESMITHIKGYGNSNENLATCFYKYWLSIGAKKEELNYLLHQMLGDNITLPNID